MGEQGKGSNPADEEEELTLRREMKFLGVHNDENLKASVWVDTNYLADK